MFRTASKGFIFVASRLLLTQPGMNAALADSVVSLSLTQGPWKSISSPWQSYFGIHDSRTPNAHSFQTVREFGGPNVTLPSDAIWNLAPTYVGPFSGQQVHAQLETIRAKNVPFAPGLNQLIPQALNQSQTSMYLVPAKMPVYPNSLDKDTTYWIMRLAQSYAGADQKVLWQWGNEINSIETFDIFNQLPGVPANGGSVWDYFNQPAAADAYVENYLAPGVEAMRRVSQDAYGTSTRLPVVLGSIANSYNPQSRSWLDSVLNHAIVGTNAPTLAGKKVWELTNTITMHYPLADPSGESVLQSELDAWVKSGKVSSLWITEEHGAAGQGPVTVVDRGMRFMSWAANNNLTADQTRLLWWGTDVVKPGGTGDEAIARLGRYVGGAPLAIEQVTQPTTKLYLMAAGEAGKGWKRILLTIDPSAQTSVGSVQLEVPAGYLDKAWSSEWVKYSASNAAIISQPTVSVIGDRLTITLNQSITEPSMLWLTTPGSGPMWSLATSGNWNVGENWGSGIPNGVGSLAQLGQGITSPQTIFTNTPVTLGKLSFDNASSFHIAGQGSLMLDGSAGAATVEVLQGSHKINLPLVLNDDAVASVAASCTLTIGDPLYLNGHTLTKSGSGALVIEAPVYSTAPLAGLFVSAGAISIGATQHLGSVAASGGSVEIRSGATIAAGSLAISQEGKLLLNGGQFLLLANDAIALNGIAAYVAAGNITPFNVDAASTVGFARADALFGSLPALISGQWLDADDVIVRTAVFGDANLDGLVDSVDFGRFLMGYGKSAGSVWTDGDFDHDRHVNSIDFNLLAGQFGSSATSANAGLGALVPEPATVSAMILLFAGATRRR